MFKSTKTRWIARWIAGTGLAWSILGVPVAVPQDNYGYNEAEQMLSLNTVELKDQLNYGLRVAFTDQQMFVDQVVAKVEAGELSRAMVNVVYVWAKKRKPNIPFPYFEYVMRLLAEKRGITFE
jgi:hypothetical protein